MLRRSFLHRLAGIVGGVVGIGGARGRAEVLVACPECGRPALPRRRYEEATEYVCLDCAARGEWPLAAYTFTRKANDPNYYCFFPADIDAMMGIGHGCKA